MQKLAKATGGKIVSSLKELTAEELGYATRDSYQTAMNKRGIKLPNKDIPNNIIHLKHIAAMLSTK